MFNRQRKYFVALIRLAVAYNDCVNRNEHTPDAKDYNAIMDMIEEAARQAGLKELLS